MKETFDYEQVPDRFIHCFNPHCPKGENCLCHLAALHISEQVATVTVVNPTAYPADAEACPHFRKADKVRLAWGTTTLFDNLPFKKAKYVNNAVQNLYSHATYHRIKHGLRSLPPKEQEEIRLIFHRFGIEEAPVFDRYTEEYSWFDRIPV
ncbi:DUF6078 family protein [Phocaeicola sp.]